MLGKNNFLISPHIEDAESYICSLYKQEIKKEEKEFFCTGNLVNKNDALYIATAEHCFYNRINQIVPGVFQPEVNQKLKISAECGNQTFQIKNQFFLDNPDYYKRLTSDNNDSLILIPIESSTTGLRSLNLLEPSKINTIIWKEQCSINGCSRFSTNPTTTNSEFEKLPIGCKQVSLKNLNVSITTENKPQLQINQYGKINENKWFSLVSGDSGGGLICQINGTSYLVGVNSSDLESSFISYSVEKCDNNDFEFSVENINNPSKTNLVNVKIKSETGGSSEITIPCNLDSGTGDLYSQIKNCKIKKYVSGSVAETPCECSITQFGKTNEFQYQCSLPVIKKNPNTTGGSGTPSKPSTGSGG